MVRRRIEWVRYGLTGKLPWLALVEVDFGDGSAGEGAVENFLEEVVGDELLVGGVEAESGGKVVAVVVMGKWRNVHWGKEKRWGIWKWGRN